MAVVQNRRKRRRKPTMTPRFGQNSVAFEIGLLRMTMGMQRELEEAEKKADKSENK